MSDRHNRDKQITRRRVIQTGAVSLPILAAGCLGDDDDEEVDDPGAIGNGADDDGVADDDDDSDVDPGDEDQVTYRSFASFVPQDTQFNPYNPTNGIIQGTLVHWAPLMQYHVGTDQWIPMVASDWRLDGTTAIIDVSDEFTWHNGDPVTAEDVRTRLSLMYYMEDPLATYMDGPPVVGNGSVELPLVERVDGDVFWPQVTGNSEYHMQSTPESIFGEYVERFEDAGTDGEIEEVQSDLLDFSPQDPGENVFGNGPFEFVGATEEAQVFERHDDYPIDYVREKVDETIGYDFSEWPDELLVDRFEFQTVGDLWAAYRSETLDGGADNAPPEVYAEYPEGYHQVGVTRDEMWGLTFQYDHDLFGQRNVRKAIAHIVDRSPPLSDQMFPMGADVHYDSGMTTSMTEDWVSSNVIDSFTDYTGENYDEAATLLEEEGFSEDGGEWFTPDGDRFSFELRLPAYDDIIPGFQVVESHLEDFGIQVDFNAMELATFTGDVEPTGDFTIIASSLGNQPHPLQAYQFNWQDQPAATNYDMMPEVPEIGDTDGDPSVEVDVEGLILELATAQDPDRVQEIVDTLAWVHNQDVPYVACAEKAHQYCVSYARWNMPETVHEGLEGHDPLAMTHTPWHFPMHCGAIEPL